MKKKISLKLFMFLVICLMSVFCIQMRTPAYANGSCTNDLNTCEAACPLGTPAAACCLDRCYNVFVECDGNRLPKASLEGCPQV